MIHLGLWWQLDPFLQLKPSEKSSTPREGELAVIIRDDWNSSSSTLPHTGLAISYKMGPLCNWWEDGCNDGNWQTETGRVSGEDRKLSQKEAEEKQPEMASGSTFNSWSKIPVGAGYLVRRQWLSSSESLRCFDVRSAWSSSKPGTLGTLQSRLTHQSNNFDGL